MGDLSKALFFALVNFILNVLILSTTAKAARLELDEASSTCFISYSVFAYAGANSDSDTYQGSSLSHLGPVGISAGAGDSGAGAEIISAFGWDTFGGDYYGGHHLSLVTNCWSHPYIDEYIAVPAGSSVNMNAEGNLVWEILPSNEDEDLDIPVFLFIDFSFNSIWVGNRGTNVTYEMGIYDYTFGPETEISGPYYMQSYCCPGGQDSTFPEEGETWVVAHFGDSIGLSYNTSVSAGTDDPMITSGFFLPLVEVSQWIFAYPLEVFFWDRELPEDVEGACSDGESRVIVELILPYPCELFPDDENPTCIRLTVLSADGKDNGHLTEEDQDNDGDGYDDTPRTEYGVFTQTWCAPAVFDSIEGAANTAKSREILIQFEIDTDNDGTYDSVFVKHIDLVRPPVVMVHGLWGNGGDFGTLARQLEQNGWLKDLLYHPSYNNKASLEHNKDVVPNYVNQALTRAHDMKYACSKVDIVAHSMGGLLAKRLAPTFAQKNVRKIITIGSPYQGSPLADLLINDILVNKPALFGYLEIFVFDNIAHNRYSLSGGAVHDLRCNGGIHVSAEIPGVDCRGIVVGLHDDSGLFDGLGPYLTALKMYKNLYEDELHNYLFGADSSDWVVSATSQRGGATSLPPISVSWHSVEPRDEDFIGLVIETLNQPAQMGQIGGSLIANESSMGTSREQKASSPDEKTYFNKITTLASKEPNGTIEITSPNEGQICTAGGHITISVQGTGDTTHAGVFAFFGSSSWGDIVQLPWTGDVNVPSNSVGSSAKIYAIGLDADTNMTDQDEVDLVLDTNVVLEDILFGFSDTWYFDFIEFPDQSHQFQLYPLVRFSDGSEYPLSIVGAQTDYYSSNPAVATVDASGVVTAITPGSAVITITNSAKTTALNVEVQAFPGDLNLDDIVNFRDFAAFASAWMSQSGETNWNPACDISWPKDNIIDWLDLAVFTQYWLVGVGHNLSITGDFDGNGGVNFADFAIFASAWMSQPGQANWSPACDISEPKDNIIDWSDLAVFTEDWLAGVE